MREAKIPPPPPGFELESEGTTPPPPPGFELETPKKKEKSDVESPKATGSDSGNGVEPSQFLWAGGATAEPEIKTEAERQESIHQVADNVILNAGQRGANQGALANILNINNGVLDDAAFEEIARLQKENQGLKTSDAYKKFSSAKTAGEAFDAFKESPASVITELSLESLSALARHGLVRVGAGAGTGAAMGAVGGPITAAAGAGMGAITGLGLSSLNLEYSGSIMESIAESGVDTTDPEALKKAFSDEEKLGEMKEKALLKGVPVALFDMLSGGLAGRFAGKAAKTVVGKAGEKAAEFITQTALGGAGEAAGQLASEGEIKSVPSIMAEMIGETGPAIPEVAIGTAFHKAKLGQPTVSDIARSVGSLPPDVDKVKVMGDQIDMATSTGEITPEVREQLIMETRAAVENDSKIPAQIQGEQRAATLPMLVEKNGLENQVTELEAQKEQIDPAFHSVIDEQIKVISDRQKELTKEIQTIITPKEDAVQITGSAEVDVRESPTDGSQMGEGNPQEEVAQESVTEEKITPDAKETQTTQAEVLEQSPRPISNEEETTQGERLLEPPKTSVQDTVKEPVSSAPVERLYVSKEGKHVVAKDELGNFVVTTDKGKPVTPYKRRKVLKEYTENYRMERGERAEPKGMESASPSEVSRFIAENSKNPKQILEEMSRVQPVATEDDLDFKERVIAENLAAISPESFNQVSDRNLLIKEGQAFDKVSDNVKLNYLREGGMSLDEVAQATEFAAYGDSDGSRITEQDVVDFILKYPEGVKSFWNQKNPTYQALRDAFFNITGFNPTAEMIEGAGKETDSDFGGNEPVDNEVGVAEEPEEKKRALGKRMMADARVPGQAKAAIPEEKLKYIVQKNSMSVGEARSIIADVGIEKADEMVRDLNNGMNGAVRMALGMGVALNYDARGEFENSASMRGWLMTHSTDMGQAIQMLSRYDELSPQYTFESSEKMFKEATGLELPEHLKPYFENLAKQTEKLQKELDRLKSEQLNKNVQLALDNTNEAIARERKTPTQRKKALSDEKLARKKELARKFAGVFNDFTNIPALLANKEFLEYNKLIVEEAVNDFREYVKILVADLGIKARQYARELYVAGGGTELPAIPKPYLDEAGKLHISPQIIRDIVANSENLTADELVGKVMEIVKEEIPDITEVEIKEAISGYGRTVNPSKDELDAEIRRLKRDARLELGLDDVLAGKGVKRTGLQRDKPTDYQRELERKIREELKNYPPDEESVQKKWASALDRTKSHLKNQIADITKRIEDIKNGVAETLPSKKRGFELDEEAKELKELRDELRAALQELEPKQEMSDEQRVKMAVSSIERAIENTANKIKNRDFAYKQKVESTSPEIIAAKERLKQGRDVLNRMRQEEGFAKEHAYNLWKKRVNQQISKIQKQIDERDFSIRPKKVVEMTDEQFRLKVQLEKLKFERDVFMEKSRLAARSFPQKATDLLIDVISIPKSLMASADLSAPLRQGAILTARHPVVGVKAFGEMLRQAFSEEKHIEWLAKLHDSDVYGYMKHAGLYLSEPSVDLAAKEEQFVSNIAERIPVWGKVVKGSGRAYNGYLNKLRVDIFTQYYNALRADGIQGKELETELESYAKFINNASGRGSLGPLESSALILNSVFFSPRYVASRFNMMNPVFYAKMTPKVRMEALKSVGAYIGIVSATIALWVASGDDDDDKKDLFTIELDPRSSDFGKVKWGDTRFDLWAGFQQWVRLFAQFATGERKTLEGELVKLGEGYKADDRVDIINKFVRSKFSPSLATGVNLASGKDMIGQPVTVKDELVKLTIPLYMSDMKEVYESDGWGRATATALPAIFGVGVQTYSMKPDKKEFKELMDKRANDEKKKNAPKTPKEKEKQLQRKMKNIKQEIELMKLSKEYKVPYVPK